jgi:hypothetical protein
MTMFHREQFLSHFAAMEATKEQRDICFFGRRTNLQQGLSVLDKEEMTEQMREWRSLAKAGKLKIMDCNCKTTTLPNNKKAWFLVVQPFDPETGNMKDAQLDPVGLFIVGEMVSGYIYVFDSKRNRDAVKEYVMKGIDSVGDPFLD